ncbi:MAG: serine/threonine protein kinase [Candidatus Eremiobacteraeota bacterium]|nr:serine/threonine protein kinase [Candidatus Eremiobacteraeota bacterium]
MGRNHNLWLNLGAFGVIGGVALFYVKGSFNAVVWPVLGLVGVAGLLQVSFRLGGSTVRPPKAPPPPPPKPAPSKAPAIVMEDLRVVREVGRYALVKELGRGAFGTVYKAVDTQCLDRFWAIKETELSLDSRHSMEDLRNFFDQEQKVLSWLNHPGIVARRDYFTEGNSLYLVMEYVPGYTLRQVLNANRGAFLQDFVVGLAETICEALAYLHAQRPNPIIFRDLKPGNLMLAADGAIKLIDFGICRLSNQNQMALDCMPMQAADEVTEVLGRCQDTVCLGTPGYAAPEQYPDSGMQSDTRADLYALGVLMWEMLTDERPPRTPQRLERIRGYNATAHDELQPLLDRATALDRNERFSSAKMMARALAEFRQKRICVSPEKLKADRQMAYTRTHNILKTNFF